MGEAYSTFRIVFNRSNNSDVNVRVFESLSCGSLLLTDELPEEAGLSELFRDGIRLASYREADESLDKARFDLDRPELREKIAARGMGEVHAKHAYRHRME